MRADPADALEELPGRPTSAEFRHVIGHFATGVTVITTTVAGRRFGTTASALSSVSLEPPTILICMNKESETGKAISLSRRFAVNILGQHQHALAEHFASKRDDKFDTIDSTPGALGQPLLRDVHAYLECAVTVDVTGGTHDVFLAEVLSAGADPGEPLAYYRGRFGRLDLAHEHAPYTAVARRVLGLPEPAPDADAIWRVVEDVLDSRCAMELGAIAFSLERLSGAQLARLRREASAPALDFHDLLVGLAGGEAALAAYRSLPLQDLVTAAHQARAEHSRDEHLELVAACERGDVGEAQALVRRHADELKAATRRRLSL